MFGIRLRFMDLLYAAVIGNSLQLLHPEAINAKFLFGIFLLVVILEDFFLYYADVAPENPDAEGLSFLGMLSEISVLSAWFFAFQAFTADNWHFIFFLMVFFALKTWAGFVNCLVSKTLLSLKFGRELLFLISVSVLAWIGLTPQATPPSESGALLLWIAGSWAAQTILWWGLTKFFRSREGKQAILNLKSAPHFNPAPGVEPAPALSVASTAAAPVAVPPADPPAPPPPQPPAPPPPAKPAE